MFQKIENIEEVNVVVCDSIKVERTSAMFALCNNLVSLNLKKIKYSKCLRYAKYVWFL